MKKILSILICFALIFCLSFSQISAQASTKIGDVDLDNDVTILDATYIQQFAADIIDLTPEQKLVSDTDANNRINVIDATIIQKYLANLIPQLPHVVKDPQISALVQNIRSAQTDTTLTLSVLSDVHFDENHSYNEPKLNNFDKFEQLQNQVNSDFVVNLGDFVVGNEEKAVTISSLKNLLEIIESKSNAPILNVRGNHDDNGWYTYGNYGGSNKPDEIINDKEWCDIALSNLPQNFVIDSKNPNGGYGYIDHESSKIRIFVLNSSDIPYVLDENGAYRYNSYIAHAFSDYQLDFVANALHFSDKQNPNDWAALFLTHAPIDTSNYDGERFGGKDALIRGHEYMLSIINAYKNGTNFKADGYVNHPLASYERPQDFYVSVDVDYSQKGCGEVIAFFNGHTHTNNYSNEVGLKNSLSYGYTYIGTIGAESFSNYVINRESKTISAFSYGKQTPEYNEGTLSKAPQSGSIESGVWSVTYDQFLPSGTNLFSGLSQKHDLHYTLSNESTHIDLETLELNNSMQVVAARKLTKAVAVKPFTTYVIPDEFTGDCLAFGSNGAKSSYLRITDHGDYKSFTTDIRHYYVVFSIDTGFYKNYEDFYVKELYYNLFD